MPYWKRKGYMAERKVRKMMEEERWKVVRAGGSLGEADLIAIKKGKCVLLQIKSTRQKILYYYGFMEKTLEEFPFYLVVDFGYDRIRVLEPKNKVEITSGKDFKEFLKEKG